MNIIQKIEIIVGLVSIVVIGLLMIHAINKTSLELRHKIEAWVLYTFTALLVILIAAYQIFT